MVVFSFTCIFVGGENRITVPIELLVFVASIFLIFLFRKVGAGRVLRIMQCFISVLLVIMILGAGPSVGLVSRSVVQVYGIALCGTVVMFTVVRLKEIRGCVDSFVSAGICVCSSRMHLGKFFDSPGGCVAFYLTLLFVVSMFMRGPACGEGKVLVLDVTAILSVSEATLLYLKLCFFIGLLLGLGRGSPILFKYYVVAFDIIYVLLLTAPSVVGDVVGRLCALTTQILNQRRALRVGTAVGSSGEICI